MHSWDDTGETVEQQYNHLCKVNEKKKCTFVSAHYDSTWMSKTPKNKQNKKKIYLHLMIRKKFKNRLSDVIPILHLLRGGTNYTSDSLFESDPSLHGVTSTYIWRLGHMAIVLIQKTF